MSSHPPQRRSIDSPILGRRLRQARRGRGLTLRQAAADTISPSGLAAVEREQRGISLEALEAVAKRLEAPLRSLLEDTPGAEQAARLMLARAEASLAAERPEECLRQLDLEIVPDAMRALALFWQGLGLLWTGDAEAALPVFHEALAHVPHSGDPTLAGRIDHNVGQALYELRRLDEALDWYRQAFDSLYALNLPFRYAKVAVDIGHVLLLQGEPDLALTYYDQAHKYTDPLGDFHTLGAAYSGMSEAYHAKGDDALAVYYARLSMSAFQASGDARSTAAACGILAARLLDLGDLEEAERVARDAISRSRATESPDLEANARSTLARVLLRRGDTLAAEHETNLATSLAPDRPTLGHLEAWLVLAEIAEQRSDLIRADALYQRALDGFVESGFIARYSEVAVEYSERLRRRGDLDRATEIALRAAGLRGRTTSPIG